MARIQKWVDVERPVEQIYDQWTQLEMFPSFMAGVHEVRQLDDRNLLWRVEVAGRVKEWKAEITEQVPDRRIAWRSREGVANAGVVTFHRVGPDRTRVMLQLDWEPQGLVERAAAVAGLVATRVAGDLGRFKQFAESPGAATGACRDAIERRPAADARVLYRMRMEEQLREWAVDLEALRARAAQATGEKRKAYARTVRGLEAQQEALRARLRDLGAGPEVAPSDPGP